MDIQILGSIVHPVQNPNQYFGMLNIYTDQPPLFLRFTFTVMDNRKLCPHILFFDDNMRLFLEADGQAAPEDLRLSSEQLVMYKFLAGSVSLGILKILGRKMCGFNPTLLVHKKPKRGRKKRSAFAGDEIVPFAVEFVNLDEQQAKAILKLGTKLYDIDE